jgi:hypothetical protein
VSTVAALSYDGIGVPRRTDNKNAPARRLNAAVFGVVAIILVALIDWRVKPSYHSAFSTCCQSRGSPFAPAMKVGASRRRLRCVAGDVQPMGFGGGCTLCLTISTTSTIIRSSRLY